MYQIYNANLWLYFDDKFENFADVLEQYYRKTYFREKSYYGFFEDHYEVHQDKQKIDYKNHIGDDGASYYLATTPGNWVYEQVHARELYWEKKENRKMRMEGYRYRSTPVPHVHKMRGGWLRYPRTQNEMRANADPEIRQYVRPARRPICLPNSYDDIPRSRSRCWKDNCKSSKQYWKHKKGEAKASPFPIGGAIEIFRFEINTG